VLSIERFRHYLILEGVVLLLERKPAMFIQDRMNSFLDRRQQYSMFNDSGAGSGAGAKILPAKQPA